MTTQKAYQKWEQIGEDAGDIIWEGKGWRWESSEGDPVSMDDWELRGVTAFDEHHNPVAATFKRKVEQQEAQEPTKSNQFGVVFPRPALPCPECKGEMQQSNTSMYLTSPAQYDYTCIQCGHKTRVYETAFENNHAAPTVGMGINLQPSTAVVEVADNTMKVEGKLYSLYKLPDSFIPGAVDIETMRLGKHWFQVVPIEDKPAVEVGEKGFKVYEVEGSEHSPQRLHQFSFSTYSEAKEFLDKNPRYNGIDYWDGKEWHYDYKAKPDYTITAFRSKNQMHVYVYNEKNSMYQWTFTDGTGAFQFRDLINNPEFEIYSVINKEGLEITVGKMYTWIDQIQQFGVVVRLIVHKNECRAFFPSNPSCDINLLSAATPLFTTEDGVEIYEGMQSWVVNTSDGSVWQPVLYYGDKNHSTDIKLFSTKEKAEAYVRMNRPRFSLVQVHRTMFARAINFDQETILKEVYEELKERVP